MVKNSDIQTLNESDDSSQDPNLRTDSLTNSLTNIYLRDQSQPSKDWERRNKPATSECPVYDGSSEPSSSSSGGILGRHRYDVENDDVEIEKLKEEEVTWMSLPHKRQLAVLTLARLSEPLVQTSLQAYMFYQLKSFDPSLSDSIIAGQAGVLAGSFTAAQFLTAMVWGRVSDSDWAGRKMVLLVGLFGTMVSCVGFGFARTFPQAVFFRVLGGALNGNVGVMRTMISG